MAGGGHGRRPFAETCYNFHTKAVPAGQCYNFHDAGTRGSNLRLCEFQGSLLQAQMTRVIEQANRRTENATYLSKLLNDIPGIKPAKLYDGVTRSAYHLYMFRYDKAAFGGLDRAKFLDALGKEGVPASSGYGKMNRDAYVTGLAKNKHYLKVYGEKRMADWLEQAQHCPQNDQFATAVWLPSGASGPPGQGSDCRGDSHESEKAASWPKPESDARENSSSVLASLSEMHGCRRARASSADAVEFVRRSNKRLSVLPRYEAPSAQPHEPES